MAHSRGGSSQCAVELGLCLGVCHGSMVEEASYLVTFKQAERWEGAPFLVSYLRVHPQETNFLPLDLTYLERHHAQQYSTRLQLSI